MPGSPAARSNWLLASLAVLVAVRVIMLIWFPSDGFPDRFGYLSYADRILESDAWLHGVEGSPLPPTAFRAMGYPLLLAGAQSLSPDGFTTVLRCIQAAAIIVACIPVFGLAVRVTGHPVKAAAAVIGFGTSVSIAYETSLLPDSLLIAAWIAIVSVGLNAWLDGRRLGWGAAAGLAICALVIAMTRGNGLHIVALTAPAMVLAVYAGDGKTAARAGILAVVYAPSIAAYLAVAEWNHGRTGERFFTTGAQIALVQPIFHMERLGAEPFAGDDPVSIAVRSHAQNRAYEEIYTVNRFLFTNGMTPRQIADANAALYLQTVAAHPGVFLRMMVRNLDDKFVFGLINPAFGLNQSYLLTSGTRLLPGFSKIVSGKESGGWAYPYAAIYAIGMAVSAVLFVAGMIAAPVRAAFALASDRRREAMAVLVLWLICTGVLAYYCALFLVLRYVIMLSPFIAALGFWALRRRTTGGLAS